MPKYGLVLEGGGARGSYEVGAYLALVEMGFKFDAIVGTSIGALNAALFAGGDAYKCLKAWRSLDLEFFNKNIAISNKKFKEEDFIEIIKNKVKEVGRKITDIGISPKPLFDVVESLVDEDKIRNSEVSYGLCTVNLSDFKTEKLFAEDIEEGKLKNYIIASCYLPIFKMYPLDGKYYLDGGFASQAPIDMVTGKNLTPIVIRLRNTPSRDNLKDAKYIISPKKSLGGLMDFDPDKSDKIIRLGYFDAYKEVEGLKGDDYYIRQIPEEDSLKYIYLLLKNEAKKNNSLIMKYVVEKLIPDLADEFNLKDFYDYREILYKLLEREAKKKRIEELRIYDVEELVGEILNE